MRDERWMVEVSGVTKVVVVAWPAVMLSLVSGLSFAASKSLQLQFAPTEVLDVKAFNGAVSVREVGTMKTVEVRATVRAHHRADLDRIEMHGETRDGVLYIVAAPQQLAGTGVSLEIRTPPVKRLRCATRNGPIRIRDVRGDIEAHTSNAVLNILGAGGAVTARSSNARVGVVLGPGSKGPVEITTTNAPARFTPGEGFAGVIVLQTTSGGVTTRGLTGVSAIRVGSDGGEIRIGRSEQVRARIRTTNAPVHVGQEPGQSHGQ